MNYAEGVKITNIRYFDFEKEVSQKFFADMRAKGVVVTTIAHAFDGLETDVCGNVYSVNAATGELIRFDPVTGAATYTAEGSPWGYVMVAAIVAFVAAIVTSFKPKLARFTSLIYAAAQGVVLGVVSHMYDLQFNGIVVQAVLGTLGVFVVMLVLFGLRVLRATPRFTKGVIAATFGVMFIYLIGFVMSLFGVDLGFWGTSGSPLGIIISVVVCIVAALNLILDFEFIEQGTKQGLPAYMDWYAGFGLMVTLVWLYLEMLRLLARLQSR
jgi:uncharacterized YccA/Bax inhibitor family protein